MTTEEQIQHFEREGVIDQLAAYAKRIGWNGEDTEGLIRGYINDTAILYRDENRDEVMRVVKQFLSE